jgi:3-hydroxyacyl-[acyl-carrier-protein] dehydratase
MKGTFYFDPADRIYADHFPGRAVVPGSLIVHAFLQEAHRAEEFAGGRFLAEEFRFTEFITPGTYSFTMETDKGRLRCRLYHEGKTVVTGFFKPEL